MNLVIRLLLFMEFKCLALVIFKPFPTSFNDSPTLSFWCTYSNNNSNKASQYSIQMKLCYQRQDCLSVIQLQLLGLNHDCCNLKSQRCCLNLLSKSFDPYQSAFALILFSSHLHYMLRKQLRFYCLQYQISDYVV